MKPALHRIDPGGEIGAPVRVTPDEAHGGPGLRARLAHHLLDVVRPGSRLDVIDERLRVEHRANAGVAQSKPDVDILPTVLGERFVETADAADRRQRHRDVRRPEVVAAVVPDAPDWRRQIVGARRLRSRRRGRSPRDAVLARANVPRRSWEAAKRRRR